MTDDAILKAAEQVLLEQGLEAPMELIASRAGVAVGTLYNHFKDRRALVASLLDAHREQMRGAVREAEARAAGVPLRDQLTAILQAVVGGWSRIYLVMKQNEAMPDAKKRREIRERFVGLFGPLLERGQAAGALKAGPVELQALALQGLMQAYFSLHADDPKGLAADRAVALVVAAFLDGAGGAGSRP